MGNSAKKFSQSGFVFTYHDAINFLRMISHHNFGLATHRVSTEHGSELHFAHGQLP